VQVAITGFSSSAGRRVSQWLGLHLPNTAGGATWLADGRSVASVDPSASLSDPREKDWGTNYRYVMAKPLTQKAGKIAPWMVVVA
jgi:hypothetical protein